MCDVIVHQLRLESCHFEVWKENTRHPDVQFLLILFPCFLLSYFLSASFNFNTSWKNGFFFCTPYWLLILYSICWYVIVMLAFKVVGFAIALMDQVFSLALENIDGNGYIRPFAFAS